MKIIYTHFLDTNIVLAIILPNDESLEDSKEYFNKSNEKKYFSNTAYSEAKNVINRLKRISLKILKYIRTYLSKNLINNNTLNSHIEKIKKGFLRKYNDKNYPEGIEKDKFEIIITNFFDENVETIKDILLKDDKKLLKDFKEEIIVSFRIINMDLKEFITHLNCITFIKSPNCIKQLEEIGLHEKDAILINESNYLSLNLNTPIAFITFDKGILRLSKEINNLFSQNIHIFKPTVYLKNTQKHLAKI